ncbi:MAG: GLPGLI family protein [Bacteroidales bacterium]
MRACIMETKILIFIVSLFLSPAVFGQETIDNEATIRAEYHFIYKCDSTLTKYENDIFYLDICKKGQSFFYSKKNYDRDSVKRTLLNDGLTPIEVMEKIRGIPRGLTWSTNKQFINNNCVYHNKMMTRVFFAEFPLHLPKWTILQDTLIINSYVCKKAVAQFMGRKWTAWFTTDITINDGPWLLWGLPGFIMQAYDSNRYFIFECYNIGRLTIPYAVLGAQDFYITKSMTLQQFLKAEKLFYEDPISFPDMYIGGRTMDDVKKIKRKYIPFIL